MSDSIVSTEKACFLCGRTGDLHRHHIFGGPNRRLSEADGVWCWLCPPHHNMSNDGVHLNREQDLKVKRAGQKRWEEVYGSREEFIRRYGKSYM